MQDSAMQAWMEKVLELSGTGIISLEQSCLDFNHKFWKKLPLGQGIARPKIFPDSDHTFDTWTHEAFYTSTYYRLPQGEQAKRRQAIHAFWDKCIEAWPRIVMREDYFKSLEAGLVPAVESYATFIQNKTDEQEKRFVANQERLISELDQKILHSGEPVVKKLVDLETKEGLKPESKKTVTSMPLVLFAYVAKHSDKFTGNQHLSFLCDLEKIANEVIDTTSLDTFKDVVEGCGAVARRKYGVDIRPREWSLIIKACLAENVVDNIRHKCEQRKSPKGEASKVFPEFKQATIVKPADRIGSAEIAADFAESTQRPRFHRAIPEKGEKAGLGPKPPKDLWQPPDPSKQ